MIITYSDLKKEHACRSGLSEFRRMFGNGGEVTPERVQQWADAGGFFAVPLRLLRPEAQKVYHEIRFRASNSRETRVNAFLLAVEAHDKIMRAMG